MTYHDTALAFLRKGYQVIPLSRKTGNPIIKFKDIPITEEIIKSVNWFNCDYALLMRGVWAIDIDTHNMDETIAEGLKFLLRSQKADLLSVLSTDQNDYGLDGYSSILRSEYKSELIKNFNNTFLELTASGGMHVLFKKREDIPYAQKIGIMPGIDIKANDNNYVKIFPSEGREVLQAVKELPFYEGEFEQMVFRPKQQIITQYFSDSLPTSLNGSHEGKEAYDRIITGMCMNRNDDLFKASCWAIENNQSLAGLMVIVGTVKGRDVFTQEEFERTIESARRKVNYVTIGT
ncbi:bifunctional DNA primase/polymerase [Streptococcus suis]